MVLPKDLMQKIKKTMSAVRKNGNGHNGNAGTAEAHPRSVWEQVPEPERQSVGWISPRYDTSRSITLDPLILAKNRCLVYLDNTPQAEPFRVLRSQLLQRTRQAGANTIMITSALPGEGKTTTAINLAVSIAKEFEHTVMLVDADLRKQSVHEYLGTEGEKGLVDHLVNGTPLSELVNWPGIEKLTFISGGRLVNESAEILGSPRMRDLIADMKGRYPDRYVIFDASPVLAGADVLTLAPLVDKIVLVVHAGKTSLEDVSKALQYLPQEKVMGVVLNRSTSRHASYYHKYYYGNRNRR